MDHYTTTIEIHRPIKAVFEALSVNIVSWWGHQDRPIEQQGDVFTVSWGEPWYQFEVIEFVQDQKMIWKCTDANQIIDGLEGVQKEWVGTHIHWQLEATSNTSTRLHFEHRGLMPAFICFQFCSDSWDHFLKNSLVQAV